MDSAKNHHKLLLFVINLLTIEKKITIKITTKKTNTLYLAFKPHISKEHNTAFCSDYRFTDIILAVAHLERVWKGGGGGGGRGGEG